MATRKNRFRKVKRTAKGLSDVERQLQQTRKELNKIKQEVSKFAKKRPTVRRKSRRSRSPTKKFSPR